MLTRKRKRERILLVAATLVGMLAVAGIAYGHEGGSVNCNTHKVSRRSGPATMHGTS